MRSFSYELYTISRLERAMMSPDETITLFSSPWPPGTEIPGYARWLEAGNRNTRDFEEKFPELGSLSLCYCSVYDDCWQSEPNGGEP